MIISKTPYRISFFGGGSDYPSWYNKYSGSVLSTSIDKHIYITCRFLPKFFDHKYRIVWSKIENVQNIKNIKHPIVKNLLNHLMIKDGLEIHYDGDLPAASGMGSSSAFTVGLINGLYSLLNKRITNFEIAKKAINFEQQVMKETVGSQDKFKIIKKDINNINRLENNLLLIYTGKKRVAQDVAKKYSGKLTTVNKRYIDTMIQHVNEGEKIIKGNNLDDFGKLLHSAWLTKKKLSTHISSTKIDEIYDYVIKNGALGGKLLGAGGGGFFLFYMRGELKESFLKKNKKLVNVPFKFSNRGTEILFKDLKR